MDTDFTVLGTVTSVSASGTARIAVRSLFSSNPSWQV